MTDPSLFEIFLAAPPGLEAVLAAEAAEAGFAAPAAVPGGVTVQGDWREVWRANLALRGTSRVLVRVASFRALHLAQLDKRARRVAWAEVLRPDLPIRVEADCRKSRIYHAGAAAQRVERAIKETLGAPTTRGDDAAVTVKVRIDDDLCTISLDTSGAPLHRRGHKQEVAKAPLRETLAALFLRQCGHDGTQTVADPMCGSGTFVIEAAEIAAGLHPGRSRAFAFEHLAGFDAEAWTALKEAPAPQRSEAQAFGSDRDAGAVRMSRANADRAGIADRVTFQQRSICEFTPPDGPPGLVMVNPPYGDRIGDRKTLTPLYKALGETLRGRFSGWRVGLVTSEADLARAAGLPLEPAGPPVPHGGLRITLYRTPPLD